MQRDLGSFPLPPAIRIKLKESGFSLVEDVVDMKPTELSRGSFNFVCVHVLISSTVLKLGS